jgi:hypothetical protein
MDFSYFKGFWDYLSNFPWWQGLIILICFIITLSIGKFWRNVISYPGSVLNKILYWIGQKLSPPINDTLQYRMFWGLIRDVLNIVIKDEIRRSFKENGFHELSGLEFSLYVKDKSKNFQSMLKQQIINLYPSSKVKMIVSMEEIIKFVNTRNSDYEDIFFEIYTEAKRIKKNADEEFQKIDKEFIDDINLFVQNSRGSLNCMNCLMMLFGKREIYENKKEKVKVIKNQMNFVEQKIIEIQSDLINFYSSKVK